jgi:hypothetical protein
MAIYELRYSFDYGSGICLWSSNEEANKRFGYAVELEDLGLPSDVENLAIDLLRRFDMSLNWDDPLGPSVWSIEDRDRFGIDSQTLLQQLCEHLGKEFRIKDEQRIW